MKIGIMGGTFDPIHNGHLMLADTAYRQFELDEVWFLPNGNPPHKKESSIGTDARHRSAMVALAIEGRDDYRVEEYEVRRREVSCSYQTLEYFQQKYPQFLRFCKNTPRIGSILSLARILCSLSRLGSIRNGSFLSVRFWRPVGMTMTIGRKWKDRSGI